MAGTRGQFYQKQTAIIKRAIEQNADPSYQNSPAKAMALQSAESWEHSGRLHVNDIMSTLYANYRQYGCGGLTIAVLVAFNAADQQDMIRAAQEELSKI